MKRETLFKPPTKKITELSPNLIEIMAPYGSLIKNRWSIQWDPIDVNEIK